MEELEKKADVVARLLLAATTKHEKFDTPDPKPAGMVEKMVENPANQEQMDAEMEQDGQGAVSLEGPDGDGQGSFDGFDEPAGREGNLTEGGD